MSPTPLSKLCSHLVVGGLSLAALLVCVGDQALPLVQRVALPGGVGGALLAGLFLLGSAALLGALVDGIGACTVRTFLEGSRADARRARFFGAQRRFAACQTWIDRYVELATAQSRWLEDALEDDLLHEPQSFAEASAQTAFYRHASEQHVDHGVKLYSGHVLAANLATLLLLAWLTVPVLCLTGDLSPWVWLWTTPCLLAGTYFLSSHAVDMYLASQQVCFGCAAVTLEEIQNVNPVVQHPGWAASATP